MPKVRVRQSFVAVMVLFAMLSQGTWALAGTTGNLAGTVTDSQTGRPIAGAKVSATSPSQSASAVSDNAGHFVILSLTPDTYNVTATADKYDPATVSGISVFADQTQTVSLAAFPTIKTIAKVTSRAAGALVKPGTTSDVYSVNSTTAAKVTGLGGGGSLDQAYSAIATMPGAYVPVGQAGWYQTVYIRGGDYDQVGYEVDGVPVNRAFDNYPASTASALGQNEVQVYTGASPANAEGQGLSGYINQVIKAGTYPGFGNADLAIGGPAFYHKAMIEAGGASPNHLFSYYAGFAGYNQNFRTLDNNEGASYQNTLGTPFGTCPGPTAPTDFVLPGCYNAAGVYQPGWYILGPFNYNATNMITDRENVVNFHFGIPHRADAGRDDVQLLWQASNLKTYPHLAPSDWGPLAFYCAASGQPVTNCNTFNNAAAAGVLPTYSTADVYLGPVAQLIPAVGATAASFGPTAPYAFPSAPNSLSNGSVIPFNQSDAVDNSIGLVKLQYQKNFSSNAYLRLYGYTSFSDWFNWGPNSNWDSYSGSISADYELSTHTRGLSATFADQINSNNLLQVQGSYTSATSLRMNNLTMDLGDSRRVAVLVDSLNPLSGFCYHYNGGGASSPAYCDVYKGGVPAGAASSIKVGALAAGAVPNILPGTTCNGNPCAWYTTENGYYGRYNTVKPNFGSASITDEWEPNAKLHVNLGLRYDSFDYVTAKTDTGARPFWFSSWNAEKCYSSATGFVNRPIAGTGFGPCPAGTAPALQTDVSSNENYTVLQPRLGLTYTMNPFNVLRFSAGKYDQAPNAAFQQYDDLSQNLANRNRNFYTIGFNAPSHNVRPEISYNYDFSWEHQIRGTDMSFKLTPFYRKTKDQIQQFYLDIKTSFVSGLNVGAQTSEGVEFQLQKGNFNANGLAALLSYTYTNAFIKYSAAPNGKTPITDIDTAMAQYNGYTSACAAGGALVGVQQYGTYVCGTATATASPNASPCFTTAGTPTACGPGTVANPYYNAPSAGLFDPYGTYAPYDLFPAASPGAGSYGSYVTPHVATLVLNYKHDKFAITPALQFSAGTRWGYPISTLGVDPAAGCGVLPSAVAGDPRYPYGAPGGQPFDASTCGGTYSLAIPNPQTKSFDGVGAYTYPARLTLATQISYDISPKITSVLTLANIVDTCFGGSKGVFNNSVLNIPTSKICGYGGGYSGVGINPIGNNFNPGQSIQPFTANSYYTAPGTLPFNAYLDFKIKL